jgi:multidrug efflux system membrane fusion protein
VTRLVPAVLCAFGLLTGCLTGCKDKDDERKPAAPAAEKKKDADDDGPGVTVPKEAQLRAGIKVEALTAHALAPEFIAYGRLEEDPSSSFEVRAPVAGTLREAKGRPWPSVGQSLQDEASVGLIEPRLTLTDQLGLKTQLATARADLNASLAAVAAAQTVYDRARVLNADNKNISDRAFQEAGAKLTAEQSHEAGARALIQALESPPASVPVAAVRGGDVFAVLAQPGESVEPGTPLVRLARFDHLLARVDFPIGERVPATGATARIFPAGFEGQAPLTGQRIAVSSASDPHAQGVSLLYRLSGTLPGLRPGAAVSAHFTLPGTTGQGVSIPPNAVVQQDGRSWIYLQVKDDRFARRPALGRFAPGDRVVVTGAQTLLSEELKSQNEADTN